MKVLASKLSGFDLGAIVRDQWEFGGLSNQRVAIAGLRGARRNSGIEESELKSIGKWVVRDALLSGKQQLQQEALWLIRDTEAFQDGEVQALLEQLKSQYAGVDFEKSIDRLIRRIQNTHK